MAPVSDDDLWAAIGDPTRRRVLELLAADGPASASGLSRELPISRQAVAKHLAVLERTNLVQAEPSGREVRYAVDAEQFARAQAQLASVSRVWNRRLQRIKTIAETLQHNSSQEEH